MDLRDQHLDHKQARSATNIVGSSAASMADSLSALALGDRVYNPKVGKNNVGVIKEIDPVKGALVEWSNQPRRRNDHYKLSNLKKAKLEVDELDSFPSWANRLDFSFEQKKLFLESQFEPKKRFDGPSDEADALLRTYGLHPEQLKSELSKFAICDNSFYPATSKQYVRLLDCFLNHIVRNIKISKFSMQIGTSESDAALPVWKTKRGERGVGWRMWPVLAGEILLI